MDFLIIALVILNLALQALFAHQLLEARKERKEMVDRLVAKETDYLDRLMAKDLSEVKREQRDPVPGNVTSKRQNDQKLYEKNARLAGVDLTKTNL